MKTLIILLIVLAALLFGTSFLMVWSNFRRRRKQKLSPRQLLPYLAELDEAARKLRSLGLKHIYCKSGRFRLHAQYLDRGSDVCVIFLHGIGGRGRDRFLDAEFYLRRGYNLLFPDLRANGSSQGFWQGMGQYERQDLLCWTEQMVRRLGPDCRLILDGTSMGASAALLFAGDGRERNLAAVVAEAGFSSAMELIRYNIRQYYLPAFVLAPLVRMWGRLLMGYDLRQADIVRAQEHSRIPLFVLHGEDDDVVPCYMARRIWGACAAPKQLLTVPQARHVQCRVLERPLCEGEIDRFLKGLDL